MKVYELFRLLLWPLIAGCAVLAGLTFFAQWVGGRSELLDYLMGIIDLREERTIGTWFQSGIFILVAVSFFLVSRHKELSLFGRAFFVLSALGFCFLSADEALALHEFFGYQFEQLTGNVDGTELAERGYSWVMLYGVAALVLLGFMQRFYRVLCRAVRPSAHALFAAAWVGIAAVFLMENAESATIVMAADLPYLTCFEELFELTALMLFYAANLLVAEEHDL